MAENEFSSKSPEHMTPPWIIDLVYEVQGVIDFDPCSTELANRVVKAKTFYTKAQDGLLESNPWRGKGWINPPGDRRGKMPQLFFDRLSKEFLVRKSVTECHWLCFNISQLRTLQQASMGLMQVASICVPKERVRFISPQGFIGDDPTRDNAILYVGPHHARFASVWRHRGLILRGSDAPRGL